MDAEIQRLFVFHLRRHHHGVRPFCGDLKRQTVIELIGELLSGGGIIFFVTQERTVGAQYKRLSPDRRKKKEQSV